MPPPCQGYKRLPKDQLLYKMRVPNPDRIWVMFQVRWVLRCGAVLGEGVAVSGCAGVTLPHLRQP